MANVSRETIRKNKYDTVIIGAGISGCVAAALLSEYGIKTLIINISMDNPAYAKYSNEIGGKRYKLLKEINKIEKTLLKNIERSAFLKRYEKKDGSYSYIFDRRRFSLNYKYLLERKNNLITRQGLVHEVKVDNDSFTIVLNDGEKYYSDYLIVSCGTFLNGITRIGKNKIKAGRQGEISSINLAKNLSELGILFNRFISNIAASIDGKTINIKDEVIDIDYFILKNSCINKKVLNTYYFGNGCKYFKIYPYSPDNEENYVFPFFSLSSEPEQEELIHKIYCLEKAIITRPAYSIEFDCIDANQIKTSCESKKIKNIYFPGEINGIIEYEKIAYQGVLSASDIINKYFHKKVINMKIL